MTEENQTGQAFWAKEIEGRGWAEDFVTERNTWRPCIAHANTMSPAASILALFIVCTHF